MIELAGIGLTLLLIATNLITLTLGKNEIKQKTRITLDKKILKKPVMLVDFYRADKTKETITANPDTAAKTINVGGNDYMFAPADIIYNPQQNTQQLVIKEGSDSAINTQTWQPGEIDPRLIATAYKIQKQRGREEAYRDTENQKKFFYIIIAGLAAILIVAFITMQNTETVTTIVRQALKATTPTIL